MMRDPTGPLSIQEQNTKWSKHDVVSWTDYYKFQVPYGIDPTDLEQAK